MHNHFNGGCPSFVGKAGGAGFLLLVFKKRFIHRWAF